MSENTVTVRITTPEDGSAMRINVRIGPAPSIQAASSSSAGRLLKN